MTSSRTSLSSVDGLRRRRVLTARGLPAAQVPAPLRHPSDARRRADTGRRLEQIVAFEARRDRIRNGR